MKKNICGIIENTQSDIAIDYIYNRYSNFFNHINRISEVVVLDSINRIENLINK